MCSGECIHTRYALNAVLVQFSEPIDPASNMLITVPGGGDGPGGVLICAENFIYWKNQNKYANGRRIAAVIYHLKLIFSRYLDTIKANSLVCLCCYDLFSPPALWPYICVQVVVDFMTVPNSSCLSGNREDVAAAIPRRSDMDPERGLLIVASATHRRKNMFFFLVQSEFGDVYRITLDYENDQVRFLAARRLSSIFDEVFPTNCSPASFPSPLTFA